MLDCYTTKELLNIADKIWKRTRRDLGGAFDLPTFKVCFPQRAATFCRINTLLIERVGTVLLL